MKKEIVILFGPPGAGKGTQAELLSEKFDLYHFETSGIIEREIGKAPKDGYIEEDGGKYYFEKEKELWKAGKVWDPPFVIHFVKKKIRSLFEEGKGIVFSGSPRTPYEAEKIIPLLKETYGLENINLFLIEISPEETLFRNSHRRICELMRHPVLYNEDTKDLETCPLDGSKLVKRKGLDDPETIKVRLKEYKERTYPALEVLKKGGVELNKINGEQSVANVFEDILKALE